jgi:hypothetical protein
MPWGFFVHFPLPVAENFRIFCAEICESKSAFDECLVLHVSAVGIRRVNNDALNSLDQLEGAVVTVPDRLCRPAPAAIRDGVGGGDFCCGRRVLASHHADQDIERGSGVASRQRADFGD